MLNKTKPLARSGFRGCKCCYPVPTNRTSRTRENRAWKRDLTVT